jgi:hypothetical protein
VFLPDKKAAERFFGFFTANHQNKNRDGKPGETGETGTA